MKKDLSDLKISESDVVFREYDDWNSDEPVYMKTNCFSVDIGRDRNVGYNTVNLKTGRMCGFEGTVRVELLVDAYIGGIE